MWGIDMWREKRRCPIQQKTSQPIAQLGRAMVGSSSGLLVLVWPGQCGIGAVVELADEFHRAFRVYEGGDTGDRRCASSARRRGSCDQGRRVPTGAKSVSAGHW